MQPIHTGYGYLYADGIERAGDSDLREDDNDGGYSGEYEPSAALYSPLYSCQRRLSRVILCFDSNAAGGFAFIRIFTCVFE